MSDKYVSRKYLKEKWDAAKWDMEKVIDIYDESGSDNVAEEAERVAQAINYHLGCVICELSK